jgi:hypothetical protein
MKPRWHLAQANWGRMLAPLEDPIMADFVRRLAAVNALADRSAGFVWRLQTEAGDSTDVRVFEDPSILFNMSVWESLDALRAYVYESGHVRLIRERGRWFETPDRSPLALWWIPAGSLPTAEEGRARLEHLWAHGPTPAAFTFRDHFEPGRDEVEAFCQSCSRPIAGVDGRGTEGSGARSRKYGSCCYRAGRFTEPDVTPDELIRRVAPVLAAEHDLAEQEALERAVAIFRSLERWRGSGQAP